MAKCSRCGAELSEGTRYCGSCGLDTEAGTTEKTAVQPAVPQKTVSQQVAYSAPGGDTVARTAMGFGIGGGLLGMLWGALGPYLSAKVASIEWFPARHVIDAGDYPYLVGIEPVILLIIGLVLGALAVFGAALATREVWISRVVLLVCALVGFLLGPSWLLPGAVLLIAAGLACAARRRGQ